MCFFCKYNISETVTFLDSQPHIIHAVNALHVSYQSLHLVSVGLALWALNVWQMQQIPHFHHQNHLVHLDLQYGHKSKIVLTVVRVDNTQHEL